MKKFIICIIIGLAFSLCTIVATTFYDSVVENIEKKNKKLDQVMEDLHYYVKNHDKDIWK